MPDFIDDTLARTEVTDEARVAAIREKAAKIPKGTPGVCTHCDEHSLRLVRGACAPCRDRLGLP